MKGTILSGFTLLLVLCLCLRVSADDPYERRAIPEGASRRSNPPPARGVHSFPPPPAISVVGAGHSDADLVVSEFSLNPATPTEGSRVRVRIGVYNRGNAPSDAFMVEWWAGENYPSPACTWRMEPMPARGGRIVTCVFDGYPSWYGRLTTKVVVDATDIVRESNESNNVRRMTIQVLRRGGEEPRGGMLIQRVLPNPVFPGEIVEIEGRDFGQQGMKFVAINRNRVYRMQVLQWGDRRIRARIPSALPFGNYRLLIYYDDSLRSSSNSLEVTVQARR